ncbi:MAG TPA: DUF1800 domain-containing protein [Vicinamibacterales bacterium]|nr:DUF1800 domain-containing protein [Vicinamibacterales bacterium]
MARGELGVEHLLRRAGFGASQDDLKQFEGTSVSGVLQQLLDYESQPDDVDTKIGMPGYASINPGRGFSPNLNIEHARQRWLFRMIHTKRPLQEKMALFWHNHFATAYSKISNAVTPVQATRMLALKAGELPGPQGQIELFRSMALGSFRDLVIEVAKDPAMLVWLDGRLNTRQRPQENFGREIMELFTFGLGHYNEFDVYAAARVFTGWNLRLIGRGDELDTYYEFVFNPNQHDTGAKTFTFPIYRDGSNTIPARAAADGMQDGIDFITALATHPDTGRRLARKLWGFFVSEVVEPDEATLSGAASAYLQSGTRIESIVHFMLRSRQFQNPGNWHTRYSWPVEFVVRAVKEVGWAGFNVDTMRGPLTAMGQMLFEPPDVNGWELGPGWFTTGGMLARMNFASSLAQNQRGNLVRDLSGSTSSPESVLDFFLDRLRPALFSQEARNELLAYLEAGGAWTGSNAQIQTKTAGLARLIVGSGEYQVV